MSLILIIIKSMLQESQLEHFRDKQFTFATGLIIANRTYVVTATGDVIWM
jgi:hypothetical protein